MEANGCEMSVGQCNYPVFLPLVAVQLDHHHGPADGYLPQTVMIEPLNDQLFFVPTYVLNVDADAPPGHLIPLRV